MWRQCGGDLPTYSSVERKDEREERFGRAMCGFEWIELSEEELGHIKNIRDIATDKLGQSERVACRPLNGSWTNYDLPLMVFYGRLCDHEAAKLAWNRALTRRDQVARVREMLRLLDRYGPGAPPQSGTLHQYDYDPLEHMYDGDNRAELEEARQLYWLIRHTKAPPGLGGGMATEPQPPAAGLVSMDKAVGRVGATIYGAEWIGALTQRGRWLIERYVDGLPQPSSIMRAQVSYSYGGRTWATIPSDPALAAEVERACDRREWHDAQCASALDWLETHGFDVDAEVVSGETLAREMTKDFQSKVTAAQRSADVPMAPEGDVYSAWLANLKSLLVRARHQREGLYPGGEAALTWGEATVLIEEGWLRRHFAVSNVTPQNVAIWAIFNEIASSGNDRPNPPSPPSAGGDADRRADIANAIVTHEMGPPLGPPMEPADAIDIPLFEAVYWIATKGGGAGFDPSADQQVWRQAWTKLIDAWRCGRLTVTGRPANGGFPETIRGERIVGVMIIHPYSVDPVGDPVSGTGPYIQCFGRTDNDHWERKGLNDQLYMPGKTLGWTHLLAKADELKALWPFERIEPERTNLMTRNDPGGGAASSEEHPLGLIHPKTIPATQLPAGPDPKCKKRGPTPGSIARYKGKDEALFPSIDKLRSEGKSVHAAAQQLAQEGKVAGRGSETSRAARLADEYRKHREKDFS
jgi:hypothetical protein